MRIKRASILPIFVVATAAVQPAIKPDTPTPTFRAGAKLVEVDVVARSQGAPATGLTKDDFTVFDNGKPEKIAIFTVRSSGARAPAAVDVPDAPSLSPGVVSNRIERATEAPANTVVLFLDQRNTLQTDQAFAIQCIVKFIATRRPQDRIGIYTFLRDGRIKIVQEITRDGELLSRAAAGLKAQDPDFRSADTTGFSKDGHATDEITALLVQLREIDSKQALETAAHHLATLPGRKSLIWISPAFPLKWQYLDFAPDMAATARKLNDANVALYAVDPRGVAGALSGQTSVAPAEFGGVYTQEQIVALMIAQGRFPPPFGRDTMHMLTSLTGGLMFYGDNGVEKLIETAADDGEFTYTLGFYPAQEDQKEGWHDLWVAVDKPGVNLRYRLSYFAGPASAPGANDRPALEQVLKDSIDSAQVGVTAQAAPVEMQPASWRIQINVDVHDLQLAFEDGKHSGGIDVSFYVEGSGKVITKTLKIDIPDNQFAAFLEKGIDTSQTVEAAPTTEAVRIVVQDKTTGAAGSLTVPLKGR